MSYITSSHRLKFSIGDIVSITALGHNMVILNTIENVTALLEKKSSIYSQRPELVVAGELMGLAKVEPSQTTHRSIL